MVATGSTALRVLFLKRAMNGLLKQCLQLSALERAPAQLNPGSQEPRMPRQSSAPLASFPG